MWKQAEKENEGDQKKNVQNFIKLKIGCHNKLDGYINVDIDPNTNPDLLSDMRNLSTIKNNSVIEIIAENVLEHIPDTLTALKEFHRVLTAFGKLIIISPHALNPNLHSTPDHYKGFTYTTFAQFWQDDHINYPKFICHKRRLILEYKFWQFLADWFPLKMEKLFWIFPPKEIHVELIKP